MPEVKGTRYEATVRELLREVFYASAECKIHDMRMKAALRDIERLKVMGEGVGLIVAKLVARKMRKTKRNWGACAVRIAASLAERASVSLSRTLDGLQMETKESQLIQDILPETECCRPLIPLDAALLIGGVNKPYASGLARAPAAKECPTRCHRERSGGQFRNAYQAEPEILQLWPWKSKGSHLPRTM